jgi:hypothetical protein
MSSVIIGTLNSSQLGKFTDIPTSPFGRPERARTWYLIFVR